MRRKKCTSVCSTPCKPAPRRLGCFPFFAPVALKVLISKDLLEENDRLLDTVKLDKDDYHLLKYYNMMVINRPASLFLEP